ncbi:MAG: YihY/virulence factor BrkB family protein [Ilumatobacter sp.]
MAWTTSDKVMEIRERFWAFDVFAEMMDGWRRHLSGRNASLVAFFAFLSIFPLMLAAVSILGFVLDGNEELQERIVNGAAAEIPVLGQTLAEDTEAIDGSVWALIIGLAIALFSSTKAFVGLQGALDDAWDVDIDDRAGMPVQRGKALAGLVIIALPQIAVLVLAGILSATNLPAIGDFGIMFATVAVNIVVIAGMYRFFTSYRTTWRLVFPGAIVAGIVFTILQNVGTALVKAQAQGDEPMKTINTILGLLTWLSLIGITLIMCAEMNAAIKRLGDGRHVERGPEMNIPLRN